MRKYIFRRDTILATIAVFFLMGLLSLMPLNTHVLDPFRLAFADFDYNDIAYSRLGKNSSVHTDTQIVVVNVGHANRTEIAELIDIIAAEKPKVIGVDVLFNDAKEPLGDSLLTKSLVSASNIVLAYHLRAEGDKPSAEGFFNGDVREKGYANFTSEEGGTIRYFSPYLEGDSSLYTSFSALVLRQFDKNSYEGLMKRENKVEQINYLRSADKFIVLETDEILNRAFDPQLLRDKVVLLGYVSFDPNDVEDKHFTPLNAKFSGKSLPDMNGVFIHANIISMAISERFISKTPMWLSWLVAFLLCWVHMAFFISYFLEKHIWFHLAAKIAQVLSAILFVFLGLLLYSNHDIKLDMTATLLAIVLAVDVLYFYEAFALWLHKKFGFKTLFYHENHH